MTKPTSTELVCHHGACHCGAVRFEVEAPADLTVQQCNCSICSKSGFLHLIVPARRFRLLTEQSMLSEYRWNTGVARHLFCKHCGIKSFYVPRSNPDGIDVNARCLEQDKIRSLHIEAFDGKNWEQHASQLAQLSKS